MDSGNMTPAEVHSYGIAEVARISDQMDAILKSMDNKEGSVSVRMRKLMTDPRFVYSNTEAGRVRILARYKQILIQMQAVLPHYFARVPTIPLNVRRMAIFNEEDMAGASYDPPSFDGGRPGAVLVNLRDVGESPTWAIPTLAYHEGIPGHHLQTSISLENRDISLLQRLQIVPAYNEGWALYAEYLASEMGAYRNDPYGELGMFQAELLRATRLVVDTGLNAEHWSREEAIQYMESTTGMPTSEVTAEIDRYVVWPGQACSYTIGMKVFVNLRERAKEQLGARFDLKEFHSHILENGAMPLWLLQKNVEDWIAKEKQLSKAAQSPSHL